MLHSQFDTTIHRNVLALQISVKEDSLEPVTLLTVNAADKHFDVIRYTLSSQPETTAFTIDPVSKYTIAR